MSNFLKRVSLGAGANAYSQVVTIFIQLVSVPVFLSQWNLETYGQWLILSAIPTYIALSDIGIVTVAGNRMNMLVSSGQAVEAKRVFQSAQVFTYGMCAAIALIAITVGLIPLFFLGGTDEKNALLLLVLSVLLGQIGGLAESVFKATKGYAIGAALSSSARLSEWLGYLMGLFLIGNFTAVALGGFTGRLLIVFIAFMMSSKRHSHLKWGFREARYGEIRMMLKPALSFLLFTLSNAFTFQGFTILCGALFGPAATVVFTTYRTLARVAVQASSMLSHALWPEFTALFAQGRGERLGSIYKRSSLANLAISVGLSGALFLASGPLLTIWTHGAITLQPILMAILLGYAAVAGCGHLPRVVLMATNNHTSLGVWFALVSLSSVALGWVLAPFLGLSGLAIAMTASEISTIGLSLIMVRNLLQNLREAKVGQFA
ncbi:hypothetical protein SRABI26_04142 [Arthrobacter sp. Bi26]|uniref:lipopolysaccharide biosynthesis protein n=1 Tax=Arthrobacter sp. Bi26 TaxID=2822350 RepID=UPI001DF2435B|nr:hypothetical protein [Arthrobacter sp. Bi26]CAH0287948.1 hypothetical protein SRABI26_04142 [Arthrobacter sp. Bi26]